MGGNATPSSDLGGTLFPAVGVEKPKGAVREFKGNFVSTVNGNRQEQHFMFRDKETTGGLKGSIRRRARSYDRA